MVVKKNCLFDKKEFFVFMFIIYRYGDSYYLDYKVIFGEW